MGNWNLREKIQRGVGIMGTWCLLPSYHTVNVIARSGVDFVLVDMEHGAVDFDEMNKMTLSAQAEGCSVIVRLPEISQDYILKALDVGVDGIIVPHVETCEDMQRLAIYSKYPPLGARGYTAFTRAGGYRFDADYTRDENRRVVNGIIIESVAGLNNIDVLLQDIYTDIYYLGAYDLSVELGYPGEIRRPEVFDVLKKSIEKIKEVGKYAGLLFHTEEDLAEYKKLGVKMFCYKVDSAVLYESYRKMYLEFLK